MKNVFIAVTLFLIPFVSLWGRIIIESYERETEFYKSQLESQTKRLKDKTEECNHYRDRLIEIMHFQELKHKI